MNPHPIRLATLLALATVASCTAFLARATEANPYEAARTPGAEHRTLDALAGTFELTSTFWTDPAARPETSTLPARRELILGGRVLRLEVGPDAGGFLGSGLMGFDNATGAFWYAWTDTSTTGLSHLTGTLDARGAGTLEGMTPTPFGPTPLRVEIRFEGADEVHDYFVSDSSGAELRMLALRYRRAAPAE